MSPLFTANLSPSGAILRNLMSHKEQHHSVDLLSIAQQTMREAGFVTDWTPAIEQELEQLKQKTPQDVSASVLDLRSLLWSSIDDSRSRDLDQVEYAETLAGGNTRLSIGIADVDAYVPQGSAIDQRRGEQYLRLHGRQDISDVTARIIH